MTRRKSTKQFPATLPDPIPTDDTYLYTSDARDHNRKGIREGTTCPCCNQNVAISRTNLSGRQAKNLALFAEQSMLLDNATYAWVHVTDDDRIAAGGGSFAKGRHFGLVEEASKVRIDGGRAGYWRLLPLGAAFLRGEASIPKYAYLFNGECLGVSEETVTLSQCTKRFDLRETRLASV